MSSIAWLLALWMTVLPPAPPGRRLVAVTVDDVPRQGGAVHCGGPVDVLDLNRALVHLLASRQVPATALVTAGNACGPDAEARLDSVLGIWAEGGMELGNHTWSHYDLNRVDARAWLADADRGAAPVARFLERRGKRLIWFRYPFLHTGNTPRKQQQVSAALAARGWRNAPVTFDNDEWVYAAAYTRALEGRDTLGMIRIADAYVDYMDRTFAYFDDLANALFHRPVAQVLLVHASPLNRDHLGRVLDRLEARGYRAVSLETVLRDSMYASPDGYVGSDGISWLLRWAATRHMPVSPMPRAEPWVARFRSE